MPPKKRKVPEPLAVSFAAPISGVVAVRGGGVYDEAYKRFRFNAQLFDQDDAPVYVTGQPTPGTAHDQCTRVGRK